MSEPAKRATIYLDPALHRALRVKAAETEQSVSALVNEAVRATLREDAEDLKAFEDRIAEPEITYEELVRELKSDGTL